MVPYPFSYCCIWDPRILRLQQNSLGLKKSHPWPGKKYPSMAGYEGLLTERLALCWLYSWGRQFGHTRFSLAVLSRPWNKIFTASGFHVTWRAKYISVRSESCTVYCGRCFAAVYCVHIYILSLSTRYGILYHIICLLHCHRHICGAFDCV